MHDMLPSAIRGACQSPCRTFHRARPCMFAPSTLASIPIDRRGLKRHRHHVVPIVMRRTTRWPPA